jgi:drug/metabolite transporter (DMT)-like permease
VHGQPDRSTHPERLAGLFIAVTWAAVVFAVSGLLAVVLDRDPIERPVSPYAGLVSLLIAMLVVYAGVVATVPRRVPWTGTVLTAVGVALAFLIVAAIVDLDLAIAQLTSPFVAAAVVLALVPPWASWAYFASRRAGARGAPR